MKTYKYKGEYAAFIPNVGRVAPGETITTEVILEGSKFELVDGSQPTPQPNQINGVSGLQPNVVTEAEKVAELPPPQPQPQIQEIN